MVPLDFIYRKSPIFIQNLLITCYGILWKRKRLGGNFLKYVKQIKEREWWKPEEIRTFIETQFNLIIKLTYKGSPYYKKVFEEYWNIKKIEDLDNISVGDISKLPVLTKEVLRRNENKILIEKKGTYYDTTGGTTGTPVKIYLNKDIHQHLMAWREARLLNWAGVSIKDKRVTITGRALVDANILKPPYWRFNFAENQMYIPSFVICEKSIRSIIEAINKWKPAYIIGYANSILYLLQLMDHYNMTIKKTKIITIAEKVQPELKKLCLKYELPLFEEYGLSENVAYATTCEYGNLHLHTDFGFVGVIDHKLIATSLINYVYPLIRYDTGDLINIDWSAGCKCGRPFPIVKEIIGRGEEYVLTERGKISLNPTVVLRDIEDVRTVGRIQIIQNDLKSIEVLLEVMEHSNIHKAVKTIQRNLESFLGKDFNIKFKPVDRINLTKSGKFRFIIRKI